MKDEENLRLILKNEMELAHLRFTIVYKKVSKGLTKIYNEATFSNDLKEIQKLHARFFGFIKMSKNAKEKWKE